MADTIGLQTLIRNNSSAILRLGSAGLSFVIVFGIAIVFETSRSAALSEFFYTSLVGVVCGGFTSFTLTRYSDKSLVWSTLFCGVSGLLVFLLINQLLGEGVLGIQTLLIAATFFFREVLGYCLRRLELYSSSVLTRDYFWRLTLVALLFGFWLTGSSVSMLNCFLAATGLALIVEVVFTISRAAPKSTRLKALARHPDKAFIETVAFDLFGKSQSLAIAYFPIYLTSIGEGIDASKVVLFVLCERASRPLAMILSQGLLDFQSTGLKLGNLLQYSRTLIASRRLQIAIGLTMSPIALIAMLHIYQIAPNPVELAFTLLFFGYVIVFNLTTSHSALNHKATVTVTRSVLVMCGIYAISASSSLDYSAMVGLAVGLLVGIDIVFLLLSRTFHRIIHA